MGQLKPILGGTLPFSWQRYREKWYAYKDADQVGFVYLGIDGKTWYYQHKTSAALSEEELDAISKKIKSLKARD